MPAEIIRFINQGQKLTKGLVCRIEDQRITGHSVGVPAGKTFIFFLVGFLLSTWLSEKAWVSYEVKDVLGYIIAISGSLAAFFALYAIAQRLFPAKQRSFSLDFSKTPVELQCDDPQLRDQLNAFFQKRAPFDGQSQEPMPKVSETAHGRSLDLIYTPLALVATGAWKLYANWGSTPWHAILFGITACAGIYFLINKSWRALTFCELTVVFLLAAGAGVKFGFWTGDNDLSTIGFLVFPPTQSPGLPCSDGLSSDDQSTPTSCHKPNVWGFEVDSCDTIRFAYYCFWR